MSSTLDYYAVRDEYVALHDKVKALEQTYNDLNGLFKQRVSQQQWKKPSFQPPVQAVMPAGQAQQQD